MTGACNPRGERKSRYCILLVSEDKQVSSVFRTILKAALPMPSGSPAINNIICDTYILSSNDSTKFVGRVEYRVTKETIGQEPNKKLIDSPKGVSYNPSRFVEKWREKYGNSCG